MKNSARQLGLKPESKSRLPIRVCSSKTIALGALGMALATMNILANNSYNYRAVCPYPNGGKKIVDRWGEWECECTSYAADKLNERGVPFRWNYRNVNWEAAGNWIHAANLTRTPYNKMPRRGDVAWWSFGHVAYVDAVDSYGNVTLSEYNWGWNHNYNTRTLKRGTSSYPTYFIHF